MWRKTDAENVRLNFRSKSSISGQLKSTDCIIAACVIKKLVLVRKFCVCCWKSLQSIIHSSTLKAAGIIPNTQFFQKHRSAIQCSHYQQSELGAQILNNPDRFAQIHKMTMLSLLWYNNACSKTSMDCPKRRKGANTAGRKAIRCYFATFVTAGAPRVLQLELKAAENLSLGGSMVAPMLSLDLLVQLSSNMQGGAWCLFVFSDLK